MRPASPATGTNVLQFRTRPTEELKQTAAIAFEAMPEGALVNVDLVLGIASAQADTIVFAASITSKDKGELVSIVRQIFGAPLEELNLGLEAARTAYQATTALLEAAIARIQVAEAVLYLEGR